ncbi:cation:proton antiporter [Pseudoclavibacter helvolus]|uniref:cation:proton antiporter n=1 Tax=Pseudoclavibacter helvolus TaxID=255205 RepID=UPI000A8F4AD3|nr:cation:proton antiporter [Pseudoclavibacter helvolus]
MAGNEIRFRSLGGGVLGRASMAWVVSLAMGLAAGFLIAPGEAAVIIAIALSSAALGTFIPILRDAGELGSPFGKATTAMGAVGEFGPLVAISVFLGTRSPGISALVLALFVVITGIAILVAVRMQHGHLHRLVSASLHTSGQFAVRVVIFTLACLVALSAVLDLDILLGAFAVGVMWQIIMRSAPESDREQVESKIEAIAFGFLVPLFFIYTGSRSASTRSSGARKRSSCCPCSSRCCCSSGEYPRSSSRPRGPRCASGRASGCSARRRCPSSSPSRPSASTRKCSSRPSPHHSSGPGCSPCCSSRSSAWHCGQRMHSATWLRISSGAAVAGV